jgi:hypothetical protein
LTLSGTLDYIPAYDGGLRHCFSPTDDLPDTMKVALDYRIRVDDAVLDSSTLLGSLDKYRDALVKAGTIEGAIVLKLDNESHAGDYFDPILRLGGQWIRKLPWVLGGDTETVAFRDSEHCFGFVPAGDSVELSFFQGPESEVEEYIVEPSTVRLDAFAKESIRLCERLVELVKAVNPSLLENDEDCRELVASLEEGRNAWRDYQLHNRR